MNMPNIIGLRQAEWNKSSPTERLKALNELEAFRAAQDGRMPCSVQAEDIGFMRGQYDQYKETIEINTFLVEDRQPYQAVETLLHEDRHAYQHHVVENPTLAENPNQLRDWQMGEVDAAYIQPGELTYSTYRWQPTETDANQSARANTDALYQDTFQDTENYPEYKAIKEQELAEQIMYAELELGQDYEEQARQAVQAKYQAQQDMDQEKFNELNAITEDVPEEDLIPVDKSHFTEEVLEAEANADHQLAAEETAMEERIRQVEAELDQKAQQENEISESEGQSNSHGESDDPTPSKDDYYGYGY